LLSYFPDETNLVIDLTLARGLNYYTGIIFEVQAKNVQIGSIGGGGRYDDLTGLFGVPNIPGVGISFGLDRIYDVMESLQLFPADVHTGTEILFFNLGEKESRKALELIQSLRNIGYSCELFHDNLKMDKQFKYAEKKSIPFVVIIGEKEFAEGTCNIKNLKTGEQENIKSDELNIYSFK
jgi:histidyl-tRNA synthetase